VIALAELSVTATFSHFFYQSPYTAPASYWIDFRTTILRYFHFAFIIYWLIVSAAHAFGFYQESRRREAEAARLGRENAELQARLTQSQLETLRAQLHPHFLFNALNTVSAVIRERRHEEATELVAELGRLLRQSLGHASRHELPLREELGFLDSYLAIERARFGDRLAVHVDVAPDALDCLVPAMVLQPLVENAIRHGVQGAAAAGSVWVSASAGAGGVVLEVRDDGPGLSADAEARAEVPGARMGLANTRERLERLYGARHRFELRNAPDGGAVATLRIPRRA
jgi:LytS/YehU family sensor histidine kinase